MNNRLSPRALVSALALWVVTVTALHLGLNVRWDRLANAWRPEGERLLDVAYLPVT